MNIARIGYGLSCSAQASIDLTTCLCGDLSLLNSENIEALASGEIDGSIYCRMTDCFYCESWGTNTACYCRIN